MSLLGTCNCDKVKWVWPHYATPKSKCFDCNEWISWTISRKPDEPSSASDPCE